MYGSETENQQGDGSTCKLPFEENPVILSNARAPKKGNIPPAISASNLALLALGYAGYVRHPEQ